MWNSALTCLELVLRAMDNRRSNQRDLLSQVTNINPYLVFPDAPCVVKRVKLLRVSVRHDCVAAVAATVLLLLLFSTPASLIHSQVRRGAVYANIGMRSAKLCVDPNSERR